MPSWPGERRDSRNLGLFRVKPRRAEPRHSCSIVRTRCGGRSCSTGRAAADLLLKLDETSPNTGEDWNQQLPKFTPRFISSWLNWNCLQSLGPFRSKSQRPLLNGDCRKELVPIESLSSALCCSVDSLCSSLWSTTSRITWNWPLLCTIVSMWHSVNCLFERW